MLKPYFEKYKSEVESEILRKIEIDLKNAYEQKFGSDENCEVEYSEDLMTAYVCARKKVVQDVQDSLTEISLRDAKLEKPDCKFDEEILVDVYINPKDLHVKHLRNEVTEEDKNDIHDEIAGFVYKVNKSENIDHKNIDHKKIILVKKSKDFSIVKPQSFRGEVKGYGFKDMKKSKEYYLKIDAKDYTSKISDSPKVLWFQAYYTLNPNWRKFKIGDTVTYRIEHDSFSNKPNDLMAIIIE